jgi:hypothetical protein
MPTVKEITAKLEKHEAECLLRYKRIEEKLADGSKRFDKLERLTLSLFPFILASIAIAKFL